MTKTFTMPKFEKVIPCRFCKGQHVGVSYIGPTQALAAAEKQAHKCMVGHQAENEAFQGAMEMLRSYTTTPKDKEVEG